MCIRDRFTLEAAEEIFRHGIVVGIAFAGYTLLDLIDLRLLVECFGSILDALITMKNDFLGWFAVPDCYVKRLQCQRSIDPTKIGTSYYLGAAQVLNDG